MNVERAIQMVKETRAVHGLTVEEYFESKKIPASKELGWKAVGLKGGPILVQYARIIDNRPPIHFRWIVDGDRIVAVNGHAIDVTPDLAISMTEEEYQHELSEALTRLIEELRRLEEGK